MFEVDFKNGTAKEKYTTPKGNEKVNNYRLFIDAKGVHVLARNGAIYLTQENSKVL